MVALVPDSTAESGPANVSRYHSIPYRRPGISAMLELSPENVNVIHRNRWNSLPLEYPARDLLFYGVKTRYRRRNGRRGKR